MASEEAGGIALQTDDAHRSEANTELQEHRAGLVEHQELMHCQDTALNNDRGGGADVSSATTVLDIGAGRNSFNMKLETVLPLSLSIVSESFGKVESLNGGKLTKVEPDIQSTSITLDTEALGNEVNMLTKALAIPLDDFEDSKLLDAPKVSVLDHFMLQKESDDVNDNASVRPANLAKNNYPLIKQEMKNVPPSGLVHEIFNPEPVYDLPEIPPEPVVDVSECSDGVIDSPVTFTALEQPKCSAGATPTASRPAASGSGMKTGTELSALHAFMAAPSFWPGEDSSDDDMDWAAEANRAPAANTEAEDSDAELEGDINKLSQALAAPLVSLDPAPAAASGSSRLTSPKYEMSGQQLSAISTPEMSLRLASSNDDAAPVEDLSDDDFMSVEMPANVENCLALNTAYQEVVDENLAELERLLEDNREQQRHLRIEMAGPPSDEPQERPQRSRLTTAFSWQMFTHHYFRDSAGFGPVANADTVKKEKNREFEDQRFAKPWLQSEREVLMTAALDDERRRRTDGPRVKLRALEDKLAELQTPPSQSGEAEGPAMQNDVSSAVRYHVVDKKAVLRLKEEIKSAAWELREAEEAPLLEAVSDRDPDEIDWAHISQWAFAGQRSAFECRQQWLHFVRPCINHASWTPEEDVTIRQGATEIITGCNRWENLAIRLGTGRSAFMVFQRWVTAVKPRDPVFWTPEESTRLVKVVNAVLRQGKLSWPRVAAQMPGRSSQQCNQRYAILAPDLRRGRFTLDEDFRILAAREELGLTKWPDVAAYLPGRSCRQLFNRYGGCLAPHLAHQNWSREDDLKLVSYIQQHGPNWAGAAKAVGRPTQNRACRRRFKRIWFAFHQNGSLPAEGQLAKQDRETEQYYVRLRAQYERQLQRYMPQDGPNARQRAAMTLLSKGVLQRYERRPVYDRRLRAWEMAAVSKKGKDNAERKKRCYIFSEMNSRRLIRPIRLQKCGNDIPHAEDIHKKAVKRTARAWGMSLPGADRLRELAESDEISTSDAFVLDALADSGAQTPSAAQPAFWWRRIPLLPPNYTTVGAFKSLMLWKPRLEQLIMPEGEHYKSRKKKAKFFNLFANRWAEVAMTPSKPVGSGTTPWLQPTELTRERDRWARVRVTQQLEGKPPRVITLTMSAEDTNDVKKLASQLCGKIPGLVKMSISKAPTPSGAELLSGDSAPPVDAAAAAWHQLTARFISMLFVPALMSLQLPWSPSDPDTEPELDLEDVWGHIRVPEEACAGATAKGLHNPYQPGIRRPNQPKMKVVGRKPKGARKRARSECADDAEDEPAPVKRANTYSRRQSGVSES